MKVLEQRFSTILWDVDGTLLDFEFSQKIALERCFQSIGVPITEEMQARYDAINNSFWKRLEKGEVTREQLLRGRFVQFFEAYDIKGVDVESFRCEYQEHLGKIFSFKDDALTILQRLKPVVKQYVVTNGVASIQQSKLKLSGIYDVMDGIFISEQFGADKPSSIFFDRCFSQLEEQDKSRILIVGDSLTSDIAGGALAGITTCWYRPEGTVNISDIRPDYEIEDLHQIYELIKIV